MGYKFFLLACIALVVQHCINIRKEPMAGYKKIAVFGATGRVGREGRPNDHVSGVIMTCL